MSLHLMLVTAAMLTIPFSSHGMTDRITNPFFPFSPGETMIYAGKEDGESVRERVEVLSKAVTIDGVSVLTVRDTLFVDGQIAEQTDDWYAQDRSGNVWYLGENSKAYEHGRLASTGGSWQAGKNGAAAGIVMLAHPRVGDAYRQEDAPKVAQDEARVTDLGRNVSVPYGRFTATICTLESSPLEPHARENKCYAKGLGLVRSYSGDGSTDLRLESVAKN